jgi:D-glycero-alpha-D-manno-heptose 1-phosphate guanylyltransferase
MQTIPAPEGRQTIARGVSPWKCDIDGHQPRRGGRRPTLTCSAAILAGGMGTRLRPAIDGIPKILAPLNGRPFITFLLEMLDQAGIERAVLLTGYQADQVRQTLGDRYEGMKLSYSVEATPLGTAGALRQALPRLTSESILLLNGDSYCDVDLPSLMTAHRRRRADITMALVSVADTGRFGRVTTTANGKLTHFGEKQAHAGPGWINAGVYLLARSLLTKIPAKQALSLERDILPGWVASTRCFGFKTKGRFLDIGTPASYAAATLFFRDCGRINVR